MIRKYCVNSIMALPSNNKPYDNTFDNDTYNTSNVVQLFPNAEKEKELSKVQSFIGNIKDAFTKRISSIFSKQDPNNDKIVAFERPSAKDALEEIAPTQDHPEYGSLALQDTTLTQEPGEIVAFPTQTQTFVEKSKNFLRNKLQGLLPEKKVDNVVSYREHQKEKGIIYFDEVADAARQRKIEKNSFDIPMPELFIEGSDFLESVVDNPKFSVGDIFLLIWTDLKRNALSEATIKHVEGTIAFMKTMGEWTDKTSDAKWLFLPDMLIQMGITLPDDWTEYLQAKADATAGGQIVMHEAS